VAFWPALDVEGPLREAPKRGDQLIVIAGVSAFAGNQKQRRAID
jgi:hypothetical protein